DEDARAINREQVEFMQTIWGCVGVNGDPVPFDGVAAYAPIDIDELEWLARKEHQRWCRSKRRRGVRYAPGRGPGHPDLVPYARLDETARKKDRIAVLGFVQGLAGLGLRLPDRTERGRMGSPGWVPAAPESGPPAGDE